MPRLIEAKLWDKLLSFIGSDSPKKDKFLDQVKKTDPQLARALSGWEGNFVKLIQATRKAQIKNNIDTKTTDALLKKYAG
jgi:hypothetical protein